MDWDSRDGTGGKQNLRLFWEGSEAEAAEGTHWTLRPDPVVSVLADWRGCGEGSGFVGRPERSMYICRSCSAVMQVTEG